MFRNVKIPIDQLCIDDTYFIRIVDENFPKCLSREIIGQPEIRTGTHAHSLLMMFAKQSARRSVTREHLYCQLRDNNYLFFQFSRVCDRECECVEIPSRTRS